MYIPAPPTTMTTVHASTYGNDDAQQTPTMMTTTIHARMYGPVIPHGDDDPSMYGMVSHLGPEQSGGLQDL